MEKAQIDQLIDRFEKGLANKEEIRQIEALIEEGRIDPAGFAVFSQTTDLLDAAISAHDPPEWSDQFYDMLREVKADSAHRKRWMLIPIRYAAVGALVVGLGLGWLLTRAFSPDSVSEDLASQVEELQETLFLTLVTNESTAARLQAVNMQDRRPALSDKAIRALIGVLENDPSTNVRLAALEALAGHLAHREVRTAVISALNDESPMVQLRVAELIVEAEEPGQLESLDKLLQREDLSPDIYQQLKESIELLKI